MPLSPTARRTLLVLGVVLTLALAGAGFIGLRDQWPHADTVGRWVQTYAQLVYGLLGFLSVATTFWGRRWNLLMIGGFTVGCAIAAGFAPVVWGEQSLGIGLLAGLSGFLSAAALGWLLRVGARQVG
jgi:hypothetical protein